MNEIERLKADNARLEAELEAWKQKEHGLMFSDWLKANYVPRAEWAQNMEFRDLLAPTVELLSNPMAFQYERERELARLQAMIENKV